jgi:single-stranded-DNA-specific exonuclease
MPGLANSRRWSLLPEDQRAELELSARLGLSRLVARVLVARGFTDEASAREFLTPSLERDWLDPLVIPGMSSAADRVERAVRDHETVAVFGDFDVDGMSSTCLLTLALRELGVTVCPFIPHRFGEGYGLSREALDRVMGSCRPDLVVTVDNGIASAREVEWLLSQGVDVVVTDHHEPAELVPSGVSVVDPKLETDNPSRDLAGAGVALKLVCELGRRLGRPDLWRSYVDVATLGTLSDMMLLTGENRALVTEGIRRMRETPRPGIAALAAVAGQDVSDIRSDSLPFTIIPRLNAAGRMGTTDVAFDLLLSNDPAEAAILAGKLEEINNERREIEASLSEEAMALAEASFEGGRVIVVGGEGWHEGVKGIVASRLVNRFHVPAILFTISDGVARGSGRSVGSVDLFHAVEQCSDVLVRFGGHAGAVGVTCDVANLDAFRTRLGEVLEALPAEQFESTGEVAAVVTLDELTVSSIDDLERLQPFGQGNKKPLFAVRGVSMRNRSRVGSDGLHLRFVATDGVSCLPAIMFRTPDVESACDYEGAVDLVFEAVNETWQGRTKPKLMVKDILYRDTPTPDSSTLTDELFSRADEILSRDEYAGIAEATSFATKAVGVTFEGRQSIVGTLAKGDELLVEHDADNPVDSNAVRLVTPAGEQVGFLRRQIAAAIAPIMDEGAEYRAKVIQVTGGEDGHSLGVNVQVSRCDASAEASAVARAAARSTRDGLTGIAYDALTEELTHRMIGGHDLLPAQKAALDRLAAGRSTLCVMATGRGKSLIFHIHAAREAIANGRASVFVFPLRALVADQAFHLSEEFATIGVGVSVLTGETPLDERERVFSALASGETDVVLTTPEYLAIHAQQFADVHRIGFVVIDEAHHAGLSKSGDRSAYASLPEVRDLLGGPTMVAVTATAATPVAAEICRLCGISSEDVVVDRSIRSNLSMRDCREMHDREAALVSVVATGEKSIVYVNSREQSVSLARMLRHRVPEMGHRVAFYNAGLSRADRTRVEEAFRSGELSCIVSTSAFGEGVNLPDIRNVMLYHMPFGQVEFNQMSGRAGRDGKFAVVHMLFGSRDTRINERIISSSAPSRDDLAALYRTLTSLSRRSIQEEGSESFQSTNADLAQAALDANPRTHLDERSVSCGIGVFRELGFLETSGYGTARRITMASSPQHMELNRSIRYLEGMRAREEFSNFSEWVLSSSADDMLACINRPITPSFGFIVGEEGGNDGR